MSPFMAILTTKCGIPYKLFKALNALSIVCTFLRVYFHINNL